MQMGQVWSKADFDGRPAFGNHGGRGSVLAVTLQNAGPDGILGTADDVIAPLNPLRQGVHISEDVSTDSSCSNPLDRVREFASLHPGGAHFLMADGSVHFISETIDLRSYTALGTIQRGEPIDNNF